MIVINVSKLSFSFGVKLFLTLLKTLITSSEVVVSEQWKVVDIIAGYF